MLTRLIHAMINARSLIARLLRRDYLYIDIPNPASAVSKTHVKKLAVDIYTQFGIKEFIGVAWRGGGSDHERGLALDIIPLFFPFAAKGRQLKKCEEIIEYILRHADDYGVSYIVWQNYIMQPPTWNKTRNIHSTAGKSGSQLHTNHIHVSFRAGIAT